jgi:copper chaperone
MVTTTYTVEGMSCGHCVAAVTAELTQLAGVHTVAVDLSTGLVTVESDSPLDLGEVVAAIDEAGFEVVS